MTLQHDDEAAVDRFTDEVDAALRAGSAGTQDAALRLIGVWIAAGALLTLAVRTNDALSTVLYIAGIALVVFALARVLPTLAPARRDAR
jgi:hypothetical protein